MHIPLLATLTLLLPALAMATEPLKIEVLQQGKPNARKSKVGDQVSVHYRGTLQKDGSEFDSSYSRNSPITFTLGNGEVIRGWDEGLVDMAPGERRKLTIQPEYGYGSRAMGPIPANSVLVFDTELVAINGDKQEL